MGVLSLDSLVIYTCWVGVGMCDDGQVLAYDGG